MAKNEEYDREEFLVNGGDAGSSMLFFLGLLLGLGALGLISYGTWSGLSRPGILPLNYTLFVIVGLLALGAMTITYGLSLRRTGTGSDYLAFATFFPLGMSFVPMAGMIIAGYYAIRLLIGRLAAATITRSQGNLPPYSMQNYDATNIGTSGIPGGLALLAMVVMHGTIIYHVWQSRQNKARQYWGMPARRPCSKSGETLLQHKVLTGRDVIKHMPTGPRCRLHIKDCRIVADESLKLGASDRLVMEGGKLVLRHGSLSVGGDARVELHNVTVRAKDTAIQATDQSVVVLSRVRILASRSLEMSRRAVILFQDLSTQGRIVHWGSSAMAAYRIGHDLDAPLRRARRLGRFLEEYGRQACSGIVDCYRKADYFGSLAARVAVHFDANGLADNTKIELKHAGKAVRACIEGLVKRKRLSSFEGPVGTSLCTILGQMAQGDEKLQRYGEYRPDSWPNRVHWGHGDRVRRKERSQKRRRHRRSP